MGISLIPPLRQLLYQLDRLEGLGSKVRRGLAVLKSFVNAIKIKWSDFEIGLDIEVEQGTADSGDLESDLMGLLVAVAEAAEEKKTIIVILIDEIQYLNTDELGARISLFRSGVGLSSLELCQAISYHIARCQRFHERCYSSIR